PGWLGLLDWKTWSTGAKPGWPQAWSGGSLEAHTPAVTTPIGTTSDFSRTASLSSPRKGLGSSTATSPSLGGRRRSESTDRDERAGRGRCDHRAEGGTVPP